MSIKHEFHKKQSFFSDLFGFLMERKKWWLLPVVIILLLLGILIMLGSSAFAPFIYTLF